MTDSSKAELDLIIEVDLGDKGYSANYRVKNGDAYATHTFIINMTREQMVRRHVSVIQDIKPKSVVIRTNGTDIELHPGVVKMIVEGRLSDIELTLK